MKKNRFLLFLSSLKRLTQFFPFTVRGILALGVITLCLLYFGKEHSDLVSSVLGASLFIMLLYFLFSLLLAAPHIKRKITISTEDFTSDFISKRENRSGFKSNALRIPPLFQLTIKRAIANREVLHTTHVLKNSTRTPDNLPLFMDTMFFPHRGIYHTAGYEIELRDILGLTSRSWLHEAPGQYKVYAPNADIAPLPIMAASSQLGDTQTAQNNKSGDLFNLRAYQPGDSLKRILWKVYARSGELIVREPEPAIVPEGEVALYVLAQKREDSVVSCALSYMKTLERQNILYRSGFLGSISVSSDYDTALQQSIESIPEDTERTHTERSHNAKNHIEALNTFTDYISSLRNSKMEPHHIVLFVSESVIKQDLSKRANLAEAREHSLGQKILSDIMRQAEALHLQLHIATTPEITFEKDKKTSLSELVKNMIVSGKAPTKAYSNFSTDYPQVKVQIESIS